MVDYGSARALRRAEALFVYIRGSRDALDLTPGVYFIRRPDAVHFHDLTIDVKDDVQGGM